MHTRKTESCWTSSSKAANACHDQIQLLASLCSNIPVSLFIFAAYRLPASSHLLLNNGRLTYACLMQRVLPWTQSQLRPCQAVCSLWIPTTSPTSPRRIRVHLSSLCCGATAALPSTVPKSVTLALCMRCGSRDVALSEHVYAVHYCLASMRVLSRLLQTWCLLLPRRLYYAKHLQCRLHEQKPTTCMRGAGAVSMSIAWSLNLQCAAGAGQCQQGQRGCGCGHSGSKCCTRGRRSVDSAGAAED